MASAFTHALVGGLLGATAPESLPKKRMILVGATLAALPDLDVIAFRFGIPYESPWGHRGFTHSIAFSVLLGILTPLAVSGLRPGRRSALIAMGLLGLATLSHALLDMLTDMGLGVGLFIPLDDTRYFWPMRPLETSPVSARRFFTARGLTILANEFLWVWVPALALFGAFRRFTRLRPDLLPSPDSSSR